MRVIVVPSTRFISPPSTPTLSATAVGQTQINLAATSIAGVGATIARYYFEVALSSGGPWTALTDNSTGTYSHTGLSAGSTRYYRVRVVDSGGQESGYSATRSASTQPAVTEGIRWNPGYYHFSSAIANKVNSYLSARQGEMADVKSAFGSNLTGTHQGYTWRTVEVTRGVYDWSLIDADIAVCRTLGLKLIVYFVEGGYSSLGNIQAELLPNYVTIRDFGGGYTADWANSTTRDGFRDMVAAFVARYNDEPVVEGAYLIAETATSVYSSSALSGMVSLIQQVGAITPRRMNLWFGVNFTNGGRPADRLLVETLRDNGLGVAGPDTFPDTVRLQGGFYTDGDYTEPDTDRNNTTGQNAYLGYPHGLSDLRGTLPAMWQIQEPEINPANTAFGHQWTPAQLFYHTIHVLRSSHVVFSWYVGGFSGSPTTSASGMNAAMASAGAPASSCPVNYSGRCV